MESKTKKKLGTAVGGVAAVGAAVTLTAGTFSYFSDTTTSPNQHVKTGTVTLDDDYSGSFNMNNMAPGDHQTHKVHLKNSGSMAGNLRVRLNNRGGDAALKNALMISGTGIGKGTLKQAEQHGWVNLGTLKKSGTEDITITVRLPKDTGNNVQNKEANAVLKAKLTQKH